MERRGLLAALLAAVAVLSGGADIIARPAAAAGTADSWTVQTLEAFADTLIPGEQRFVGDRPIAGVVVGPGAVQAGAVQTLMSAQLPLAVWLPGIASLLNARALAYAVTHLVFLPPTVPAFVGLPFDDRTAVVADLFDPADADRPIWQMLALLVGLAFDSAAHLDTASAMTAGHPGLAWLGFPPPDADGLWRFPDHSYGTALATPHPLTTPSGSPP